MNPSTGVVIPSAGQGARMGSGRAKQLLPIGDKPVLAHTIQRILELQGVRHLVVPSSTGLLEETEEIVNRCLEELNVSGYVTADVIAGGMERMESVGNGIKHLTDSDVELILVHDAVRPCFPLEATSRVLQTAYLEGAAILAIPARDTVKIADKQYRVTGTPDRNLVWMAQTPQAFRKSILIKAYEMAEKEGFTGTDDSSIVEFAGFPVRIIPGSQDNIKITFQSDLFFAEQWLLSQSAE